MRALRPITWVHYLMISLIAVDLGGEESSPGVILDTETDEDAYLRIGLNILS